MSSEGLLVSRMDSGMRFDRNGVYSYIQDLFRRGVVTIIGSGASCAFGLPGMAQLSTHLQQSVTARESELTPDGKTSWALVLPQLIAGIGLEAAFDVAALPGDLADLVTEEIGNCVLAAEEAAITDLFTAAGTTSYGRLMSHVLVVNTIADVITTNYDRLIEVSLSLDGLRLDTMFYGHTLGRLDERLSREELLMPAATFRKRTEPRLQPRAHVRLAKPHGSLD